MSLNTTPVFVGTPRISWAFVSAANAADNKNNEGTGLLGTDVQTIISGSASGSRVDSIVIHPIGTNVQTNMSFFINNGQDSTVNLNNAAFYDITMPATTTSTINALNRTELTFPNGINLQHGYRILVSVSVTVATGFHVTAFGGDY